MKAKCKSCKTPIGIMPFPLNPGFNNDLDNCKNNEDLFALVEPNDFICPDAFNEILARGLYAEYKNWKSNTT